jgi:hypothetical protein
MYTVIVASNDNINIEFDSAVAPLSKFSMLFSNYRVPATQVMC